jgi:coenzyme F420-reducing hydrogenase delta subunit
MMRKVETVVNRLLTTGPEPAVLGFCCRYCAFAEGADISQIKAGLPAGVNTIEVLCTGKLDVAYLLKAFELGADGVFVAGCPQDDCRNSAGSTRARKRVEHARDILNEVGLGADRLVIYDTSLDGCQNVVSLANEMLEKIEALGPSPLRLVASPA